MKFRKKPIVIEAHQWFKNGDHPFDYKGNAVGFENGELKIFSSEERKNNGCEGSLVRYYRSPEVDGSQACSLCGNIMHVHGWIDTLEGGHRVCPGDWIITGVAGEYYPCKPHIFKKSYEQEDEGKSKISGWKLLLYAIKLIIKDAFKMLLNKKMEKENA